MRPGRIALVVGTLTVLTPVLPSPAGAHHASKLMIQQINEVRARHGLPALRTSPSLKRSSRRLARWLIAHDTFRHQGQVSASRRFKRLGEAIAMHGGRKPSIRRTVRKWLSSSAHRRIVLTRSMTWLGAGLSRGRFGRHRAVIWVLQTGKL